MNKTEKLKQIILSKYNSVREFSKIVEIPSTTLTSALDKGIGGMAVDRIIKICDVLNIDIKTFEPLEEITQTNKLSQQETTLLDNYNKLNSKGKEKMIDYSNDLVVNPLYNTTDEISATKVIELNSKEDEPKTLQDLNPTILAAHDDTLTEDEKIEADRRILEVLKNMKK